MQVTVTDLRSMSEPFNLEKHGFQLVNFPSGAGLDWQNEQQVSRPSQHPTEAVHDTAYVRCSPALQSCVLHPSACLSTAQLLPAGQGSVLP